MMIDRKNYRELDLLLWDFVPRLLTREHAFRTYEMKWGYVHEDKLTKQERKLIDELIKEYNNDAPFVARTFKRP